MKLNICNGRDHPSQKELSDAIEEILYHDLKDQGKSEKALAVAVESMRILLEQIRSNTQTVSG